METPVEDERSRWRSPDRAGGVVNLVTTLYEYGAGFRRFLDRLAASQQETGDSAFRLIVVDFGSTDIDVGQALARSGLPYGLVSGRGPFSRVGGIEAGFGAAPPGEIVATLDIFLSWPHDFLARFRSQVEPGRRVAAPLIRSDVTGKIRPDWCGVAAFHKNDGLRAGLTIAKGFWHGIDPYSYGREDEVLLCRLADVVREVDRSDDGWRHLAHARNNSAWYTRGGNGAYRFSPEHWYRSQDTRFEDFTRRV